MAAAAVAWDYVAMNAIEDIDADATRAPALSLPPVTLRAGGAGLSLGIGAHRCGLGWWVVVGASNRGIRAVELADTIAEGRERLRQLFPTAEPAEGAHQASRWAEVIASASDACRAAALDRLPLDLRGTAFQARVWRLLQTIPAGRTATYQELAAKLGLPGGARAVARACATNPVALVVPCHRVVRADGKPSGYRWGLPRKRALLAGER